MSDASVGLLRPEYLPRNDTPASFPVVFVILSLAELAREMKELEREERVFAVLLEREEKASLGRETRERARDENWELREEVVFEKAEDILFAVLLVVLEMFEVTAAAELEMLDEMSCFVSETVFVMFEERVSLVFAKESRMLLPACFTEAREEETERASSFV